MSKEKKGLGACQPSAATASAPASQAEPCGLGQSCSPHGAELVPCPFCGGTNIRVHGPYGWYRNWCISHSCKLFYNGAQELAQGFHSEADAIAAWNTRAQLASARAETQRDKDSFHFGYLIAVANIVNLHGEDTVAEDVLAELGVTESVLRRLDLTDYDAKPLRKLFREIKRKSALPLNNLSGEE